jgi:hypothetical protein
MSFTVHKNHPIRSHIRSDRTFCDRMWSDRICSEKHFKILISDRTRFEKRDRIGSEKRPIWSVCSDLLGISEQIFRLGRPSLYPPWDSKWVKFHIYKFFNDKKSKTKRLYRGKAQNRRIFLRSISQITFLASWMTSFLGLTFRNLVFSIFIWLTLADY